ncbi:MAG: phospholipase D-like domain-containing protein, partial [Gemmatimonadales bacterium]
MSCGVLAVIGVVGALFLPDWPEPDLKGGVDAPPGSDAFLDAAASFLNLPLLHGGEVTLLQNGEAFYPALLEAIRGARETVNFEVYIFEPTGIGREILEAFMERARAGVEVRLLVDGFGSHKLTRKHREELQAAGVRIERFRPVNLRNLVRIYRRTHRRAIVIDGRIGFTGGAAVADKWRGGARTPEEWRDSLTRVTGVMVAGIQSAFASDWNYCTG